jgi:hypothetical protein
MYNEMDLALRRVQSRPARHATRAEWSTCRSCSQRRFDISNGCFHCVRCLCDWLLRKSSTGKFGSIA